MPNIENRKSKIPPDEEHKLFKQIVTDTQKALRNSTNGRLFFEGLGIEVLDILNTFSLGYWESSLYKNLADNEREKLESLNLCKKGNCLYESMLVFPLVRDGRIVSLLFANPQRKNSNQILSGRRQGLYLPNRDGINSSTVILTENIIDSLILYAAGIRNVLPLFGVTSPINEHIEYITKNACSKVIFSFSDSVSWKKISHNISEQLNKLGIEYGSLQLAKENAFVDLARTEGLQWIKQKVAEEIHGEELKPDINESENEITIAIENRVYRIRGLQPSVSEQLRVNIRAGLSDNQREFHIDTLDLLAHRWRGNFCLQASKVLRIQRNIIAQDINAVIEALEEIQYKRSQLAGTQKASVEPPMNKKDEEEARAFLQQPDLIEQIKKHIRECGLVGNENQALITYLAGISRLCEKPLGVLLVSRSAAGKSYLQQVITGLFPKEKLHFATRVTGQSLFYKGKSELDNSVLSIEELEGMKDALYSIRILLSNQRLHLQGLEVDKETKALRTIEKCVDAHTAVIVSTTDFSQIDDETKSRFLILHLDESTNQTRQIIRFQEKIAGDIRILQAAKKEKIIHLQQNAQRLLKPLMVVNNLGSGLNLPPEIINSRREAGKFKSIIEAIALLHQHQRPIKEKKVFDSYCRYIEVTEQDVALAKELASNVLQQSLDSLSPLGRELLLDIHSHVEERHKELLISEPELPRWEVPFSRVELQHKTTWSRYHLRQHLSELVEAGYITPRAGLRRQRYAYALVEDTIPEVPQIA